VKLGLIGDAHLGCADHTHLQGATDQGLVADRGAMIDLSYGPISSVPVSDGFFDTLRADYSGFDAWLGARPQIPRTSRSARTEGSMASFT
jgi:hypothetical protein